MDRLEAMVPPPMTRHIDEFQKNEGYENRSQAIRELLRRGLEGARAPTFGDLDTALGAVEKE